MPYIFSIDNYFYAWSNTLRNHRFLFSDQKQLLKNINYRKPRKKKGLYLGRYVRFTTGLEKETIIKYDKLGSPVNGEDYKLNNYSSLYTKKIVDLCKENNIELIFLTLPMYYKHIENYALWENRLGELLNEFSNPWLNMQFPYDSLKFTPACFENTYNKNQHMTYNGSLIATYKLSRFIKDQINLNLPNRKSERNWIKNFYAQESYFENNKIHPKDKINKVLVRNLSTNDILVNEISLIKQKKGGNKLMLAKIAKNQIDLSKCNLELTLKTIIDEKRQISKIKLFYDAIHEGLDFYVFKRLVKPINIVDVSSVKLVCN